MKITRSKFVATAVGVAAFVGVGFLLRPKPLVVDIDTVARRALESTVDADGRTRVRERYTVVAPVTGHLERIVHVEGSAVRAGDVVARLAPLPLDSETVRQAHARVDAANALALAAAAQVRAANAELDQRRRELSRAQRLAEIGGVAPRIVEECELAQLQAEEASRAAMERTRAADADARQARAALLARESGSGAVVLVRAPAGGRVLRVPERSERIVAAGTPLLEIGDPASLEVVVDVLSSDGSRIQQGDLVRLSEMGGRDGGERPTPLIGRVREIEPAGFTKISALGVEEQRVEVIIDVDSLPATLGDGFRVDASIVVWSAPNLVVVPRSALVQSQAAQRSGGEWSAFVVSDGRVVARAVRIGHIGGTSAEVLAGLEPGDEVVVFPSDRVKAGTRITKQKS
jgi:HlyD family secretion protein